MLTKRIIPCLDVKRGRVVKGVKFLDHRDAGDPVEMAAMYNEAGADELVFYDITASSDERGIMLDVVSQVAEQVFIPLAVGGGLRSVEDMHTMLLAGADKVSINTAAVDNPDLIRQGADRFGSQCIVLGLDAMRIRTRPPCAGRCGRAPGPGAGVHPVSTPSSGRRGPSSWAPGEIVVNSMDADGTQAGYDIELLRALSEVVTVPVVASGGAGSPEHMLHALQEGRADAGLAASIFHYGTYSIAEVKTYLSERGVPVRPI